MQSLNYEQITKNAIRFIRDQVEGAEADGAIFGLSGGIDSSVIAHLVKKALGDRCLALIMPNVDITPDSETDDGILIAEKLGIRHVTVPIGEISRLAVEKDTAERMKKAVGNLNARIRAMMLYYYGQKNNYLVVGTDDKSEYLIGYFTKYGDGASDMLPIADLYKTQVQELGRFLGVPSHIVEKKPSPHLWKGHDASDELGMDYAVIDKILEGMDGGGDAAAISARIRIAQDMVERITALHRSSGHKRRMPPIAKLF